MNRIGRIHLFFIHSFNKYLLRSYYMPDTVLGAEDNTVNKTKLLSSGSLYSSRRQNITNKNMDVRKCGEYSKRAIQFGR